MPNLETEAVQLAIANRHATNALLASPQFNYHAAELLLRNMAAAADRVTPWQFVQLSSRSSDAVFDVASSARDLVTMDEDVQQLPHESQSEFKFRTLVRLPLHQLQRKIYSGDYDHDNPIETPRSKPPSSWPTWLLGLC